MERELCRYMNRSRSQSATKSLESKRSRSRSRSVSSLEKRLKEEYEPILVHQSFLPRSPNSNTSMERELCRYMNRSMSQSATKSLETKRSRSRSGSVSSLEKRLKEGYEPTLIHHSFLPRSPNSSKSVERELCSYINRSRSQTTTNSLESKRSRSRSGSVSSLEKRLKEEYRPILVHQNFPSRARNSNKSMERELCRYMNRSRSQSATKSLESKRSMSRNGSVSLFEKRFREEYEPKLVHQSFLPRSPKSKKSMERELCSYINRSRSQSTTKSLESKRSMTL
ncbi:hypothetical protein GWI33_013440 [Rhynchophorus ferrugineus]|uniref:Uncharacterized protein n=1 Tax=Rhynchophorus ferrugineus TaxID=354439 RepID=A0A834I6H2_RHYFE|nr:hypothetical protein GWI33_013440 [Rhynchophorus ferrugineus]